MGIKGGKPHRISVGGEQPQASRRPACPPGCPSSSVGPERPTCSRVRRRNSWDSSSGCSSSSASVQLRTPTSPAMVVSRRPRPATHKTLRQKRCGSDVRGRASGVTQRAGVAMPFTEGRVRGWQIWVTHLSQEDELRWRAEGCPAWAAPEARKAKQRELAAIGLPPVTSHGRGLRDSPDCLQRQNRPRGQTAVTPIGIVMSEVILLFAFYNISIVYCLISLLHKVSPNNTL